MGTEPEPRFDYGRAIEQLREQRGMTREALSVTAGISASYLYEVERGLKRPSTDVLAKLAKALGMLPSQMLEFVEGQTFPHPPPSTRAAYARVPTMGAQAAPRAWARAAPAEQPAGAAPPEASRPLQTLLSVAQGLDDDDLRALLEMARHLQKKKR